MTNSQPTSDEHEERLKQTPERIWLTPSLKANIIGHTSEDVEYVRADLAALAMRDKCVEKVKEHERKYYGEMRSQTHKELIALLESLTLDQVQEKR